MTDLLCPYFGKCGGCTSQHIAYEQQVEQKRKKVANLLGVTDISELLVFTGNDYFYRNRMDFIFHRQGLGLRERHQKSNIVDIAHCVISNESITKLLKEVRSFFPFPDVDVFDLRKKTGTFRYAVIRVTSLRDSSISFVLNEDSSRLKEAIEIIHLFAEKSTAQNVMAAYVPSSIDESTSAESFVVKGKDVLQEKIMEKEFVFPIQGFFQNNTAMAEKMQEYCRSVLQKYEAQQGHLLDLYGGVGTFGISNADLFKNVTIVENVPPAIECAQKNAERNGVKNATSVCLDATQLHKLNIPRPLFVITDPPRTGMHPKAIQHLVELQPEIILYISCNPEQLAREIPKFKGYNIKSVAMFDLFPQTGHCEVVVELVRSVNGLIVSCSS